MPSPSTHRTTGLLCVAMVVGMVIIGLWPFAVWPVNQVHWLNAGPGLQFLPDGVAYEPELSSKTPPQSRPDVPASVTVQLWVRPDREPDDDVYHLLTIHDQRLPSNLTLCQWKTALLLRIPGGGERGFREVGVLEALETGKTRLITMTCGPEGAAWYFDGVPVETSPGFTLPAESLDGRLILGDAATGKHAWSGQLYGVAVFNRALASDEVLRCSQAWTNHQAATLAGESGLTTLLLLDEGSGQWLKDQSPNNRALFIPKHYRAPHKTVLAWPAEADSLVSRDVWINLLGFAPWGFLAYWHRRSTPSTSRLQSAAFAVLVGGAISLFIELTQIWLPNRDSSSLDLACNVSGTVLGVALALLLEWRTGLLKQPSTAGIQPRQGD